MKRAATAIARAFAPHRAWLLVVGAAALLLVLPFAADAAFGRAWVRILDVALLFIMLALGLNIVVGFAGLLDLGYIAFFAVGAYSYALLASPQFGVHMLVGLQTLSRVR